MAKTREQSPASKFKGYTPDPKKLVFPTFTTEEGSTWQETMFKQFQGFWFANGYKVGKQPRDDVMVIPNALNSEAFVILLSSYKGLDEEGLAQRQQKLHSYNQAWQALKAQHPDAPNNATKQGQVNLLKELVGLEYSSGLQGVETFCMNITTDREIAERVALGRLSVPRADFAAWHSYALPEEKTTYDTPTVIGSYPAFDSFTERTFAVATGYFRNR